MTILKQCPCGKVPNSLTVFDGNQGCKYHYVMPDCCNEWFIEFRAQYLDIDQCMDIAIKAWNETTRGK